MQLTCPHCGFSKNLQEDQIPKAATVVNCPKCHQSFSLPTEQAIATTAESLPSTERTAVTEQGPQADILSIPKAGFWLRVVATAIDTVLVLILQLTLGFLLGLVGVFSAGQLDGNLGVLIQIFGYVLNFAYYVAFTGHGGQTPGKMALRIKVIRCDGSELSYPRAILREVPGKFLSGIIVCIGYLMVAFDDQKQGLHDRMAKTYVIKL